MAVLCFVLCAKWAVKLVNSLRLHWMVQKHYRIKWDLLMDAMRCKKSAAVDCKKTQKGQNQNEIKVHLSVAVWEWPEWISNVQTKIAHCKSVWNWNGNVCLKARIYNHQFNYLLIFNNVYKVLNPIQCFLWTWKKGRQACVIKVQTSETIMYFAVLSRIKCAFYANLSR